MAIELREYQEAALRAIRHRWREGDKRVLTSLPTGTGKCQSRGTYVWSRGLRTLGECFDSREDRIRAPAEARVVEGWYDDGVREGLRVVTGSGLVNEGNLVHRIWVRTVDGWEGWRELQHLDGSEYVAVARGRADWGERSLSRTDAFTLGLLVANGCIRTTSATEQLRVDKHKSVIEYVAGTLREWATRCGCRSRRDPTLHAVSPKHSYVCVSAKGLAVWLDEEFGLRLPSSEHRITPYVILTGNRQTVAAYLRGLFAGTAIELTSCSLTLLEQTQQLLLGLGVWAGLRPRKSAGLPAWRLTIRDTDAFLKQVGEPPGDTLKRANMRALGARSRNTNVDVVPGVGALIRAMAQTISRKQHLPPGNPWRQAYAYYNGTRKAKIPSYEMLTRFVETCPPCAERDECERILDDHYAWDPITSITPHTCHRVDCQVQTEHAFIGNGLVNHNTWIFVFIIYGARENGLRSLVLVNTDELVQQTVDKLERVGVSPGIMKASKNEWTRDVVVASVQTLSKATRLYNLPPNHFGLVITDECHYANAPSYQRVLWYFRDAWHLGVTATPFRGDKKSLAGAGWDSVAFVYPLKRAIEEKWLCPVKFVTAHTGVQLTGVGTSRATLTSEKDFNAKALEKLINTPQRNEKIVDAAVQHLVVRGSTYETRFRRTIAFCAGVAHSVDLANAFRRRGVEAFAIYGSLKPKHRRLIIKGHQKGLFPILCNCNILSHGYDDPMIEGLIMARPTKSKVLYLQQLGRGLRIAEERGKLDCVCLDVADVAAKHTLTIGSELIALEEAIDERGEAAEPAGLVPSAPPA